MWFEGVDRLVVKGRVNIGGNAKEEILVYLERPSDAQTYRGRYICMWRLSNSPQMATFYQLRLDIACTEH
jgi:hypothetical protein